MPEHLRRVYRFIEVLVVRFQRDDGFRLCASLAYTTLLSIVPVVAVGIGVFTAFPAFDQFTDSIQEFFAKNLLPQEVAARVLDYIDEFARNAAGLTVWGLGFLAVTAFLLMGTIETAFNGIWRARRQRPLGVRILMYWGVMTLGPVVVGASLTLTSHALATWIAPLASASWVSQFLFWLAPFALTTVALTLLFLVVPNRPVRPRHAFVGGLVAAITFELVKRGFAAYLGHGSNYGTVYGTLAAIPIFLVWIYLSWMVVLLGAEIVALAPDYHHASVRLIERREPSLAEIFAVLAVTVRALGDGRPATRTRIAHDAGLGSETVDAALAALARAGIVASVGGERWGLLWDPDRATLADVHERTESRRGKVHDQHVDAIATAAEEAAKAALARPLRTLVQSTEENSTS